MIIYTKVNFILKLNISLKVGFTFMNYARTLATLALVGVEASFSDEDDDE